MEEQILAVLRRVFKDETLDTTCSQKNCPAWDSMNQLNLVVDLEMEFGISLEPEDIGQMVSFQDVKRIVISKIK